MTYVDREFQRSVLTRLAEIHPEPLSPGELGLEGNERHWASACMYLDELGLVRASTARSLHSGLQVFEVTITARGLDFLQDDGGLTAALSVVTVRLEAESLRALLASRIEASDESPDEKSRLRRWLDKAGSDALSTATTRLLEAALDQAPGALRLLGTLAG